MLRKQTIDGYNLVKCMGIEAEIVNFDKPMIKGHKLEHVFNVLYPEWEKSVKANSAMCEFFKKYIN